MNTVKYCHGGTKLHCVFLIYWQLVSAKGKIKTKLGEMFFFTFCQNHALVPTKNLGIQVILILKKTLKIWWYW